MIRTMKLTTAVMILGVAAGVFSACGTNSNTNSNGTTANVANTASSPAKTSNPGSPPAGVEMPLALRGTPTEVYKTAYAMRKNGDIEGLKKVMSKDVLEFMAMIGEEEKKTLDDQLREMVKTPQGPSDEVRNEKITGDTATLEYLKDKDKWSTMDFEKEDGVWKMTIPQGDRRGIPMIRSRKVESWILTLHLSKSPSLRTI
jgi:hypothetical protein